MLIVSLKSISRKFYRGLVFLILLSIIFMIANIFGALLPANFANNTQATQQEDLTKEIILVSNLIHSDIALPFDDELKERFGFLGENGMLFNNSNIKYLLFGWGSRTFYISAKEWGDVRPYAVFKAITGDKSVMHVSPAGDVSVLQSSIKIAVSEKEYSKLLNALERGFDKDASNYGVLKGYSYGYGDQFFAHKDHFNVFRTCNVWVSKTLNNIGIKTGRWTPIVQAFKFSLEYHSAHRLKSTD